MTDVLTARGAVTGVRTSHAGGAQDVECEVVVNCAGMWARQLGARHGVNVPLQAAEHYYLLTEPIDGVSGDWPVLEDPGRYGYFREEGGGLMLGLFEAVCAPWQVDGIPADFSFGELPPDWDRMGPYLEAAMGRIPVTADAGIRKFFCGPESFTPDLQPVVGEAPELRNYFVCAGLNSIGILTGGGLGRTMAHWVVDGRPDVDVTGMNIDRLHTYQANPEYRATRTVESLGHGLPVPLPDAVDADGAWREDVGLPRPAGRARRVLPRRLRLGGRRLVRPDGSSPPDPGPLTWGRPRWFDFWAAEHRAAREGVICMDMSFMSKFLVQGRDAGRAAVSG